jgi:glycosyltransferase involved in cell wall biosynthesis
MLIGIDASRANKPTKTGVEWYSYHLIQQLKKIDKQNQYFLYSNKPLTDELKTCPENFKEIILKWLPTRMWTLIRLSYEMKFGKFKPELLFVPAHTIPLLNPRKVVVTVHDIGFERFPKLYNWPAKIYHRFTIKFIKRFATKIITVSEFCKKEIMEVYGIPEDKIKVVYNGFDREVYKKLNKIGDESVQLRDKFNIDAPFFMFIGRLELKKNIPNLVKAFAEFKKIHPEDKRKLVLSGPPGFGFDLVKKNIENYNLSNQVIIINWQAASDNAYLLNNADLFIFPSNYEGFGIPVLEAMACGCPVICSNTTSLPEVAGEAAVMFNPQKTKAIVKAIETVALNPEIRDALISKGFEQMTKFSWEKCARETLEILEKT